MSFVTVVFLSFVSCWFLRRVLFLVFWLSLLIVISLFVFYFGELVGRVGLFYIFFFRTFRVAFIFLKGLLC